MRSRFVAASAAKLPCRYLWTRCTEIRESCRPIVLVLDIIHCTSVRLSLPSRTHPHRCLLAVCPVFADLHRLGQSLPGQIWLSAPHQGPEPGRRRWSPAGADHPDHRYTGAHASTHTRTFSAAHPAVASLLLTTVHNAPSVSSGPTPVISQQSVGHQRRITFPYRCYSIKKYDMRMACKDVACRKH